MTIPRRVFLKNTAVAAAGIGFASLLSDSLFAMTPAMALPHSLPEAEGITSASILQFINAAENAKLGLHSLMVIRNGKTVAQGWWDPYKPELRHMLFSLSKSFTSTAIGFAVSEGRLTVEDKVTKFFPQDIPENISPFLQDMQVKHLLTMSTGHDKDTSPLMRRGDQTWVKTFLSLPIQYAPGTHFLYNSGATYMLSAIITKLTGITLLEYLTPRLLKPLEIEGADWEVSPQGINHGYAGLRVKTEDIAKLGMLYLQNGTWNGKRVLNADWVNEATTYKVSNAAAKGKDESSDWQQGYCYQFWRCRHNFFRGDGAMGQYCLVSRDLNTVIAITSETANMQKVLDAVWDNLLPGIKAGTLPPDSANQTALKQKLASLTLLPQKTGLGQNIQAQVSGKNYAIRGNDLNIKQASLSFNNNAYDFILTDGQKALKITGGSDRWINGETLLPGSPPNFASGNNKAIIPTKIAATGVWVDDKTFVITLQYFETPYGDTITCNFENNSIRIAFLSSRAAKSGSIDMRPVLEGSV